jgi:hypothetical protein
MQSFLFQRAFVKDNKITLILVPEANLLRSSNGGSFKDFYSIGVRSLIYRSVDFLLIIDKGSSVSF